MHQGGGGMTASQPGSAKGRLPGVRPTMEGAGQEGMQGRRGQCGEARRCLGLEWRGTGLCLPGFDWAEACASTAPRSLEHRLRAPI